MKKILSLVTSFVLIFSAMILLSACGKKDVESISVIADSFNQYLKNGETLDLSDLEIKATFEDDSTKVIGYEDLTIDSTKVDTTKNGDYVVTISYEGKEATITITVSSEEDALATIVRYDSELITDFESSKTNDGYIRAVENLVVGDDNAFTLGINASGINIFGELVNHTTNIDSNISVYELNNGSYTPVTDNTYIDSNENGELDFSAAAVGKTFKLVSTPAAKYDAEDFSAEVIVDVIDAFNIDSAKDMSVIDNVNYGSYWTEWKNLPENEEYKNINTNDIKGVVLLSDVAITTADLPAGYFYEEGEYNAVLDGFASDDLPIVGSLKDGEIENSLYKRHISDEANSSFIITGNLFTVDFRSVPTVVVKYSNGTTADNVVNEESGVGITPTVSAFKFSGNNFGTTLEEEMIVMSNLSILGNGPRANGFTASGGLTAIRASGISMDVVNILAQDNYETFAFNGGLEDKTKDVYLDTDKVSRYKIIDSKAGNSYSSIIYLSGAEYLYIENSILEGAGGPAIISRGDFTNNMEAAVGNATHSDGAITEVHLVDSEIASWVAGTEAWFTTNAGSSVFVNDMVKASDSLYNEGTNKNLSFYKEDATTKAPMINPLFVAYGNLENPMVAMKTKVTTYDSIEEFENRNAENSEVVVLDTVSEGNFSHIARQKTAANPAGVHIFEAVHNGGYVASDMSMIDMESPYFMETAAGKPDFMNAYIGNGMVFVLEVLTKLEI